jgi:UrcA family protein
MSIRSASAAALVSLVAAASALTLAVPAQAAMPGPIAIAAVSTAGLDLATAQGQQVLKLRLQRAAADVCGEASSVDPAGRRWVKQCRADAFGKAWTRAQAQRTTAERLATR